MKPFFNYMLTFLLWTVVLSTAQAQDGVYDVRFFLNEIDCAAMTLNVTIEVRADAPGTEFRIGDQNYRLSYNRAALANPRIERELTFSGFVSTTSPETTNSFYAPHTLTGSLDTVISYNVELSGGDGYPLDATTYVKVGVIQFDILELNQCLDLIFHTKAPQDFPPTFIGEKYPDATLAAASEGSYGDYRQCLGDACTNLAPLALGDNGATVENQSLVLDLLSNDSDPEGLLDPTTITLLSQPLPSEGTASVDPLTGILTFTPVVDYTGTVGSFDYQVCDLHFGIPSAHGDNNTNPAPQPVPNDPLLSGATPQCATATVNITVNQVNGPPVANDDNPTVFEDTPTAINVVANDSDPDGGALDPCTVSLINQPANGTVTTSTATAFYTQNFANGIPTAWSNLELAAGGGRWSYSFLAPSNWAAFGFPGTQPGFNTAANGFILFDSDSKGNDGNAEDAELISAAIDCSTRINVTLQFEQHFAKYQNDISSVGVSNDGVNFTMFLINDGMATNTFTDNPDLVTIDISAIADGQSTVYLKFKYQGDRDYWWTFDDVSLVGIDPACDLIYTPNPDYNGPDSFVYEICDTSGACATAVVSVTISPVDDAPVATDDTDNTLEDTPITTAVLTNDTDADNNINSLVTIVSFPANGTLINNSDGAIEYTPASDFNGVDTYTYQVCDLSSPTPLCDIAVVTILVDPVNDPPIATDDSVITNQDVPVTTIVLANDSDIDNALNPTLVTVITQPANGTASVNPNGTITYTPLFGTSGIDIYSYQICDDIGLCATAMVTVDVNPASNIPPVTNPDQVSVNEDTPTSIDVLANDSDAEEILDPTNITITSLPTNGTITINSDGIITYTPNPNLTGVDSFVYQVCDTAGGCSTAAVTVNVYPVDDVPVANDDTVLGIEDTPTTISVLNNDSDADGPLDPANVMIITTPSNGTTLANPDGTLTYTPDPNYNGPDTFVYQVCDSTSPTPLCDDAVVTVNVYPVDDAPVANDDTVTGTEDTPTIVFVLINDSDADGNLDPTFVNITTPPANGTVVVNSDGTLTYTPDPNFNGPDTFVYQVCDSSTPTPLCDDAVVTVNVNPVDEAPVANDDTVTGTEDTPTTISVLNNDSDADGPLDPTNVMITTQPTNGTVVVNSDGTLTYTPDPNYNGPDTFVYQVCDNSTPTPLCDDAVVTVNVNPVDEAPVANDDTVTGTEDTPTTISVLNNDSDADGPLDPTNVMITTQPTNGTMVVNSDGTLTYTPDPNYNGPDTFVYQVCDSSTPTPLCDDAVVTVNVNPVDDAPVANDDTVTGTEDTPTTVFVLINDSDADGNLEPTFVNITTPPANGTVVVNSDGTLTYTPDPNFNGPDTFVYQVCDSTSPTPLCDDAVVTVNVNPVDEAPVANDDTALGTEDTPITISVLNNDSDADGPLDPTNVTVTTAPTNGTVVVNSDGTLTYTPDPNFNGPDTFVYQVCDSSTPTPLCDDAVVTVNVNPVDDAPVGVDDVTFGAENTTMTIDVTSNDSDPDGNLDPTNVTITTPPANGTTTVNPDGTINYTPNQGFNGLDTFEYQVCDMSVPTPLCDDAVVTLNIAAAPSFTIAGQVNNCAGTSMEQVEMTLTGDANEITFTSTAGDFLFDDIETGNYTITPSKTSTDIGAGLSVSDLISIQRHIQGDAVMTDPCQLIAADVNRSCSLSVFDIIQIKQVIQGTSNSFPAGDAWRFVPVDFVFPVGTFPCTFPEAIDYSPLLQNEVNQDFIGIKLGDVNGSANPNLKQE